jgi:hypothetical protein
VAILDVKEYDQPWTPYAPGTAYVNNEVVKQQLAIGGGSVPSNAFNKRTSLLRVHCDATCRIEFGASPIADGTSMRMAANQTEYFWVKPGSGLAIAVVSST